MVLKDGRKLTFGSLINRHETYKRIYDAWARKSRNAASVIVSQSEKAARMLKDQLEASYDRISSRYEVRDLLAKGGYGSAFLVMDRRNFRSYVLKQVVCVDLNAARQAEKEMVLLRLMKHPFIVAYQDFWRDGENVVTVMEYCSGGDLRAFLDSRNNALVPEDLVWTWLQEVLFALQHLHRNLVIHRDIKTQNLFLNDVGDVKLGDFGLSTVRRSSGKKSDVLVGTYGFAAPELLKQKSYDSKSDIYSLGCTFYEVMTLRSAYNDFNNGVFPVALDASYSDSLRNLLDRKLTEDPSRRPSADELLACPTFELYRAGVEKLAKLYGHLSQRDEAANELWNRIEVLEGCLRSGGGPSAAAAVAHSDSATLLPQSLTSSTSSLSNDVAAAEEGN